MVWLPRCWPVAGLMTLTVSWSMSIRIGVLAWAMPMPRWWSFPARVLQLGDGGGGGLLG